MRDNRWTKSGTTMHDFDGWEIEIPSQSRSLTCHSEDDARRRSRALANNSIPHQIIHITNVIDRTPVTFTEEDQS